MGVTAVEHESVVAAFAEEIGRADPVAVVGAKTQWLVGGEPADGVRLVRAPAGIISYEPAEMTVKVRAGTTIGSLNEELGQHRQMVPFDVDDRSATVGGLLSVGRSGIRRRRYGHIRDFVLQATYVNAVGDVISAGGPTVKNVSGYDLCRLMVGSLGTLGLIAEVVLRCVPVPTASHWFTYDGDPRNLDASLFQASSILWNGDTTWVLLEGHEADIESQAGRCGLQPAEGAPLVPKHGRLSKRPSDLYGLTGDFLAEIGVGVVHVGVGHLETSGAAEQTGARHLHRAVKERMDPKNRLNPGRCPIQ